MELEVYQTTHQHYLLETSQIFISANDGLFYIKMAFGVHHYLMYDHSIKSSQKEYVLFLNFTFDAL